MPKKSTKVIKGKTPGFIVGASFGGVGAHFACEDYYASGQWNFEV